MTATEIIDAIKALSSQERAQVLDLLLKLEAEQNRDPAFEEATEHVMSTHADLMRRLAQ